jgi:hypothetical protein
MTSRSTPDAGAAEGPVPTPAALERHLLEPDHPILLLVASEGTEDAVEAAIALADWRAARDLPTELVDAGVTSPRIHHALGVENLEGLADVFLFGASLARVSTRPEDHAFEFVAPGAYITDPEGVLSSAGWDRVAAEAEGAGALMLVFVPAGTPGLGALSRRIGRAVVLGDGTDAERAARRLDRSCRIVATVPVGRPAPPPAAVPAAESPADGYDEEDPGPSLLTEPPLPPRPRPVRIALARVLVFAVLALVLVAVGWLAYRYAAGLRAATAVESVEPEPEPARPPARGDPVETPIPVSVAVEMHQDLMSARERVEALRRAEPGIGFYISPVAVRGGLFYSVLAGPVLDAEAGAALLQRLVDARHKTAFDSWAIRPTEYAFLLGEFDTREEATVRVAALEARDIPAYVVTIRYDPGPPRYRVYGGAFETIVEAEVMAELLENADLEPQLVPRTGEPIE